jgi:hypothetical protein
MSRRTQYERLTPALNWAERVAMMTYWADRLDELRRAELLPLMRGRLAVAASHDLQRRAQGGTAPSARSRITCPVGAGLRALRNSEKRSAAYC